MAGFVSTKFSSQTMFGEVVTEIGQAPIRKSLIGSGANSAWLSGFWTVFEEWPLTSNTAISQNYHLCQ